MRTVSITVHNNQVIGLFVEKREEGFEIWVVGPIKGRRMLLDHHLTHDDLEACLEYSKPGDLIWHDALPSEIPDEKHRSAVEMEKTIQQGTFLDYDSPEIDEIEHGVRLALGQEPDLESYRTPALHLDCIELLTTDRKEANAAGKLMFGQWIDGVVTLTLEQNHRLRWSCTDQLDPFCGDVLAYDPDWWNFGGWGLALFNAQHSSGTYIGVLHVDRKELHLQERSNRLVRVFHRKETLGEHVREMSESGEASTGASRGERVSCAAGEVTPLLRELEQAVIDRNPLLAERLNPGLPESEIRAALSQANVSGDIEALIQLYSWSNGTAVGENDSMDEISLFPQEPYRFMDLEEAIGDWRVLNEAAETLREMNVGTKAYEMFSNIIGQLFPIFTDGAGGVLAVDLTPGKRNRVMLVDFETYGKPVQAYNSFSSFIKDVIRANKEDDSLKCFQ